MPDDIISQNVFPLGRDRDACGIGVVSVGAVEPTRIPIDLALKAVCNFEHRGACMPDGTGDGTGLLMDIPREFLAREIRRLAPKTDGAFRGNGWGVAMLFVPRDLDAGLVRAMMERSLAASGVRLVLWREVPMNPGCLGVIARASAPLVAQVVFSWNEFEKDMETTRFLYKALRQLEGAFSAANLPVYIVSFSDRTLVYKALSDGRRMGELFPDLQDENFKLTTVVFHRRFATNTAPNWTMCQPFRLLCHNGEINTIDGNRAAVHMWERYVRSCGKFEEDWPVNALTPGQSDSADLDGALSAYHAEGRSLAYTTAILKPPSWENRVRNFSPELKAFFEFHKRALGGMGAWEGPAAILAYDGRQLIVSLDRMGLRPVRVAQTKNGWFLASSENGIFENNVGEIVMRYQLIPGDIVRFDLETHHVVHSADVFYEIIKESAPTLKTTFRDINHRQIREPSFYGARKDKVHPDLERFRGRFGSFLRAYGWDSLLKQESTDHLIDVGKEDIYSMGFDRALPALSADGPTLYKFFLQRFALVTNPPIDPYREGQDMCLTTYLGRMPDVPPRTSPDAVNLRLKSPVLTDRTLEEILASKDMPAALVKLSFPAFGNGADLKRALDEAIEQAVLEVQKGAHVLVLSDYGCFAENRWPLPAAPAIGSINHRLIESGNRALCSYVVQSGEISEGHDVAVLIGLGAHAVHPHALLRYAEERAKNTGRPVGAAIRNVTEGLDESVRKILSKMGISTIQGYRNSCLFEAVGLGPEVMPYLPRVPSRVGGLSFDLIASDIRRRVRHAAVIDKLPEFDTDGRAYSDAVRMALWKAAQTGDKKDWARYRSLADGRRPGSIRDLMEIIPPVKSDAKAADAGEVLRDCVTAAAMSHGALTRTAHEAIAQACNEIGLMSNSGEGGEDRQRNPATPRAHLRSRIRQISTGRFGVDAEYLVGADEIQIKMAQGAKPGEGGQLMSSKVTPEIAKLRYCRPGINLISPPPHHDIYSIEDLKQLIYDLRAVNPEAKISVKLCSVTGIGTIAAGVVKAGADIIEIDGLEGSTGASPRSSLEHAGLPTELGLRETHTALTQLGLRGLVSLRAGGGIKTETDALKYILLGADQVSLATTLMIAQGCIHCNCCHTGSCPTHIAGTLNARAVYPGSADHVKRFLLSFGEALAEHAAALGAGHPRELTGRVDLLQRRSRQSLAEKSPEAYGFDPERFLNRCETLDLSFFMTRIEGEGRTGAKSLIDNMDHALRDELDTDAELVAAVENGRPIEKEFPIKSRNSVDFAACVSGRIARRWGRDGWPNGEPIRLKTEGTAGQCYGAFCIQGLHLTHRGSCNDGVGKGMSGGRIVVLQPESFEGQSWRTTLVGNAVAFGATGGTLFVQGSAGQRLGVRNSGATIVCEGAGQYACEYMTAGTAVFLGSVGESVGAGMTDGKIFIYDPEGSQEIRFTIHAESVAVTVPSEEELYDELLPLLEEYHEATGSQRADEARHNLYAFHKVIPTSVQVEEMRRKLAVDLGHTIAG